MAVIHIIGFYTIAHQQNVTIVQVEVTAADEAQFVFCPSVGGQVNAARDGAESDDRDTRHIESIRTYAKPSPNPSRREGN